jgi:predicted transcriptional regulator
MKAVLISIKPKWCELISNGKKTIEVRKTKPKIDEPFKCYIYETRNGGHRCKNCKEKNDCYFYAPKNVGCYNGWGKVIGEFVCEKMSKFDSIDYITPEMVSIGMASCMTEKEFVDYVGNNFAYGWHITDLVIYDKPKELGEFWTVKCTNKKIGCADCEIKPNCIKHITRPPQSWQFVEELGV